MLPYTLVIACLFLFGCQTFENPSDHTKTPAYETAFSAAPHTIQVYQPSYASTLHNCNLSDRMQALIHQNQTDDHRMAFQACLLSHNKWQMLHTLGPHLPVDLSLYLTYFQNPKKPITIQNDDNNIATHIANAWSLHLQKKQSESLTHLALAIEASSNRSNLKPLLIQQFWLQIQLHGTLNNLPEHHPSFAGWMDLLSIVQSPSHSIKRIQNWILNYPDHPANALIQKPIRHTLLNTDNKALMLSPETPKPFINAIQYGLLDAYWSNGHHAINGSIHFETHNNLAKSYQRILNQPTDIMIGPLMQQDIPTLFSTPARIPTITLNHHHTIKDPNVLQWSLSPLFELDQIKAYMREKGLSNTLIIYEKSPHYQEIADYFATPAVDGQTTYLQVACEKNWSNKQISNFLSNQLGISKSNQRWLHLERITEQRFAHSPLIRDDIDSVFIAGSNKTTARIVSLLRYIAPKHLPIISSSNIHRPESQTVDASIDQVDFFDVRTSWDHLQHSKPSQGCHDTNRVHYFAYDAFAIADQWPLWQAIPSAIYHGKSGAIFLDPHTQTAIKILTKGKIIKGKAHLDKQYDFLLAKYQFLLKEALLDTYFSKNVSVTE